MKVMGKFFFLTAVFVNECYENVINTVTQVIPNCSFRKYKGEILEFILFSIMRTNIVHLSLL